MLTVHGRSGSILGRGDHNGGGVGSTRGGGGGGGGSSWPTTRPTTSRGAGDHHISPMLRPRQGQGFSTAVTPSPTFAAQQGVRLKKESRGNALPASFKLKLLGFPM